MVSRTSGAPKPAATGTSRSTTRRPSTTYSSCLTATSTLQFLSEELLKETQLTNHLFSASTSGKKQCIPKCLKVDQSVFMSLKSKTVKGEGFTANQQSLGQKMLSGGGRLITQVSIKLIALREKNYDTTIHVFFSRQLKMEKCAPDTQVAAILQHTPNQ